MEEVNGALEENLHHKQSTDELLPTFHFEVNTEKVLQRWCSYFLIKMHFCDVSEFSQTVWNHEQGQKV